MLPGQLDVAVDLRCRGMRATRNRRLDAVATDLGGSLREVVDAHREELKAIVARHRGREVALFGSVARGDASPESDIDLLVTFEQGASLFDLVRIERELEALLGRPVDVVSSAALLDEDHDIRRDAVRL